MIVLLLVVLLRLLYSLLDLYLFLTLLLFLWYVFVPYQKGVVALLLVSHALFFLATMSTLAQLIFTYLECVTME